MSVEEDLVTVYTAAQMEAHISKGRLESEGIPVALGSEGTGIVEWLSGPGLARVAVMVPRRMAEEARRILEEPA